MLIKTEWKDFNLTHTHGQVLNLNLAGVISEKPNYIDRKGESVHK